MKSPLFSLLFGACGLVASTLAAAAPYSQSGDQPLSRGTAENPGAALLSSMCSRCHDSSRILERRRTKDDWQDVIVKMIEKGATGDEKEFQSVFAYLCLNYGE